MDPSYSKAAGAVSNAVWLHVSIKIYVRHVYALLTEHSLS